MYTVKCYRKKDKHTDFYIRMNTNYLIFCMYRYINYCTFGEKKKITFRQRVLLAPFRPLGSNFFFVVEDNKYQLGLGIA
jgi:hypothetical protein